MDLFLLLSLLALALYFAGFILLSSKKKEDIVISGLGFICVNKKAKVLVKAIKNTDVFKRGAII